MSIQTRTWPILYKKSTSTGAINYWEIETQGAAIITRFGKVNGKQQKTKDIIKAGKNIGRSNETTPEAQAEAEAASKFQKYLDKGYVTDRSGTLSKLKGVKNDSADTSKFPMLAHEYGKHGHKLTWPLIGQPKYDGCRMVAHFGKRFVSRTGKPLAVPEQVKKDIHKYFKDFIVDGELYSHEFKADFGKIVSAVRTSKKKSNNLDKVQYVIYDIMIDAPYEDRQQLIQSIFEDYHGTSLVETPSVQIRSQKEATKAFVEYVDAGYEGLMLRDLKAPYLNDRRSYGLQKYKVLVDGEFRIVGVKEGVGKRAGTVGAFICEIDDEHGKRTFNTTMKGTGITAFLKKAWSDHSVWKGKWMHVEYMMLTDAEKKPRHPRGLKIIDRRTF